MFLAFVLDKESKTTIKSLRVPQFRTLDEKARPLNVCHHITLAFNPNEDELKHWAPWIGKKGTAFILNRAWDNKAECFEVAPFIEFPEGEYAPTRVNITKEHPHLTFSLAEGVSPKHSNDMLAGEHFTLREHQIKSTGKIELLF